MMDWLPIESAPRDGSYVQLRSLMGDDIGNWSESRYCMLGAPQGAYGPGWQDQFNHLPISDEFEPTHWKPTKPPALDSGGAGEV